MPDPTPTLAQSLCPRCIAGRAVRRLREDPAPESPNDVPAINRLAGRALGHLEYIAETAGPLCPEHGGARD